jgi:hypothetical protein
MHRLLALSGIAGFGDWKFKQCVSFPADTNNPGHAHCFTFGTPSSLFLWLVATLVINILNLAYSKVINTNS